MPRATQVLRLYRDENDKAARHVFTSATFTALINPKAVALDAALCSSLDRLLIIPKACPQP
eukprot:833126-Pelagomonas_calceolata.AAC.8